ncbi:MAG TPA: heavy metal-responsive transcriptional regulator [Stenomitos sp.]
MAQGLYIGDLAKRVGTNPKTIRYYEDLGLLSEPERTESGYRRYAESDVERLRFILNAKALGLSLNEIKDIVDLWASGTAPCGHVSRLLEDKLSMLDAKIQELTAFRDGLRAYKDRIDALGPQPGVACAHIAGVAAGEWHPTVGEPVIDLLHRRH